MNKIISKLEKISTTNIILDLILSIYVGGIGFNITKSIIGYYIFAFIMISACIISELQS